MNIQILQYEFLGPVKLDDWGPPMEKVIYLIFARNNDSFNIIYVGDCEKTDKDDFFENNKNFKNWTQITGSKDLLYLAILPMFESDSITRQVIIDKICRVYKPACNVSEVQEKPDYVIRSKLEKTPNFSQKKLTEIKEKIPCPCCGAKMSVDKILENTTVLKCDGCGLSDTRLNL